MAKYANYEWYLMNYSGNVPEKEFERLAAKASSYIDAETLGRAAVLKETDPRYIAVKRCCCELVDEIYSEEQGGGIASESNDGVSISYVKGISNTKSTDEKLYIVLLRCLARTGLMYRGGCKC